MSESYVVNIKKAAKSNDFFRQVLFTAEKSQLVLMALQAREEIGAEVHEVDQILCVVEGEGEVVLDGASQKFEKDMIVVVPAGVRHNVINAGDEPMKLFTVYAPPQHAPGTVHRTKAEAETAEKREVQPATI